MRSCVVLLFASLLTLCEAQGTIVTPVFVLKGRDLLLKLHADLTEGVLAVDWKINKTVNLVRIELDGEQTVDPRFTGRVEYDKFSVILKNVQEVDSGVYSAEARTLQGDKLAEYKVTVQGPVSPVELIVDRVDSSSSGSCDLHVTCRTHNSHISSIVSCFDRVCIQEGGERPEVTTSGASLQVHLLNNVIICNHSNLVHRTHDFITAEKHCSPSTDPLLHRGWEIAVCVLVAIFIVVLLIVLGVIVRLYKDQKRRIDIIQRERAALKDVVEFFKEYLSGKGLDECFASLEKRLRPEKRRVEQQTGYELVEKIDN